MSMPVSSAGIYIIAFFISAIVYRRVTRAKKPPLPPSPPGLPFLGNLFDIPPTKQWQRFSQWSQELGSPIITIDLLGTKLFIVNTAEAAEELLETRGALYCSRPRMPYLNEAAEFGSWNWGFSGDEDLWKPARREYEFHTRQSMTRTYNEKQLLMARRTMRKMLDEPKKFMEHCQFASGSFIMDMMYGMEDADTAAYHLDVFDRGSETFQESLNKNPVDVFPWIQHVPLWFSFLPGFGWRRQVEALKEWGFSMRDAPFEWFMNNQAQTDSVLKDLLERLKPTIPDDAARLAFARNVVGVTYSAGSTTIAIFRFTILAMLLYPEVQRRAQADLDAVVGHDRLPDWSDRSQLPYIVAIGKELLRWTSPNNLPHSPTQDDIFNGYSIPEGSRVVSNTWAILHNPEVYPSPDEFLPDRFLTKDGELDPSVPDPMAAFGYGRRLCPGRFIALDQMWIFTATILSVFKISPAFDASGKEIIPPNNSGDGLVGFPRPFECTIEPRSQQARALIESWGSA